jgi:hypothetical protein
LLRRLPKAARFGGYEEEIARRESLFPSFTNIFAGIPGMIAKRVRLPTRFAKVLVKVTAVAQPTPPPW